MQKPISTVSSALVVLAAACLLAGCLASPVARSGGPGSLTVPDTNPDAIRRAALPIFASHGYAPVAGDFPRTLAFERPAGRFGELMFGSAGQTTAFRVRLQLVPLTGTNDIRILTQVYRVNNPGRAGFERENTMLRSWASQFQSMLREIQAKAAHAGPGR